MTGQPSSDPSVASVEERRAGTADPSLVGSASRPAPTTVDLDRDLREARVRLLDHVPAEERADIARHLRDVERIVRARTLAHDAKKESEKAQRAVMAAFQSRRPNLHVVEAERALMRAADVQTAKAPVKKAFEDALWRLHVAYGYATAKAIETGTGLAGFREQVLEVLEEMASDPSNPGQEAPLRAAIKRVRALMVLPPADLSAPVVGR